MRLLSRFGIAVGVLLPVLYVPLITTSTRAAAADLGTCTASTIFNVAGSQTNPAPAGSSAGTLYSLDVGTAVNTEIGRFSSGTTPVNGLGVTPDLSAAYVVAQNAATAGQPIYTFAQDGATSSSPGPNTGMTLVMGAVDPANDIYYYAGYTGSGATLTLAVWGYNTHTNTALGRLVNVSMAGTGFSTGDLAFDSSGNMFVVAGTNVTTGTNTSQIRRVDGPLPTTATTPVPVAESTTLATKTAPAGSGFYNGIAFAANGTLYAQYAVTGGPATLEALNASTGATISTRTQGGVPSTGILTDLAGCSLPGTLTVQKNLPDGRAGADDQFTMTVAAPGLTDGNTNTTTGTATGIQDQKVGPLPGVPGTEYTISESLSEETTTSLDAYASSWLCEDTNTGDTISSGSGTEFTLDFPSPNSSVLGANVVCTFTNTPVDPTLTLTKEIGGSGRFVATDQFTMEIRTGSDIGPIVGTPGTATTAGTGDEVTPGTGTTTVSPATAGETYYLTEAGAGTPTADLANYAQEILCTDENGVQTGLPDGAFTGFATVTPVAGAAITCILTNTPLDEPVLQLDKALGSDRVSDTDQFTVEIRPGSTTGTPLPSEDDVSPTTTGEGAVVDPGTGTTGFTDVTVGDTYFLTETASGTTDLALYTSTVTCVDTAGIQTGLPDDEPLSDNPSVTPVLGSKISCTITNTAVDPTLSLIKALGSTRVNAGDQFTMQILGDDQTTVVGTTTDATTSGTGATVSAGTGTTTLSPATAGDTYYLNEIPAEGTPTDLEQYSATITCTDANGVQTGLPSDEPFAGPFEIVPQLGTAITCTVTNTRIPPGLELDKALGSARVADTDQFTMEIKDPTGAVVGTTADATTTGTGSTVDTGTGTTLLSPATTGTTYTLSELAAGTTDLSDYSATVTCVDYQGLQTGLPDGATFTGSITITPVAGASIQCIVTNTARIAVISLSVTKTSSPKPYTAGQTLTYTIVVSNGGPDTAAPATVSDPLPSALASAGFTWTCAASAGSACGAASGGTPLHDTPTILAGGSVTYTVTGTVPAGTAEVLTNTATVTPPPGVSDPGCTPDCTAVDVNSPISAVPVAPIAPVVASAVPVTG